MRFDWEAYWLGVGTGLLVFAFGLIMFAFVVGGPQ
jgi:hypothetical protein